jgi:putative ABC transport system substrate-binding protein
MLLALCVTAEAQQEQKMRRVGYLASSGLTSPEAFRQALRDLGYAEGKNIAFEFRASGGNPE